MRFVNLIFMSLVLVVGNFVSPLFAQQSFSEYCRKAYLENTTCPVASCQLQCQGGEQVPDCLQVCVPRECSSISVQNCPLDFCHIVTDCSKKSTCQTQTAADEIPACGSLAYNGQDVECCKGLVKRCGFDYLDGSCNMEGKKTPYNLPICIPCGDGICTNFENHCNCPEDCKKEIIPLK